MRFNNMYMYNNLIAFNNFIPDYCFFFVCLFYIYID